MDELLWTDPGRGLALRCTSVAEPAMVGLLARTVWGTNEVMYRVRGVDRILARIGEPRFLVLTRGGETIGVTVGSRKSVTCGGRRLDAFFVAMIAIAPEAAGAGIGTLLATKSREHARAMLGSPGLVYLYVETTNVASVKVHRKIGYTEIGQFEARLYTRLYPKSSSEVGRPHAGERAELVRRLERQYAGHSLLDFETAVGAGRYFVLRSGGEIVAGAQIRPMHWSIERLRGIGGFLALRVLPRLPVVSRGYAPGQLHFLQIGNVFLRADMPGALDTLIETLLARFSMHVGLLFLDPRSPVHRAIRADLHPGVLSGVVAETVEAFADFKGLTPREIEAIAIAPLDVSPSDPM